MPGSKLVTVPGANHIIVVNNPEVVERITLDCIRDGAAFSIPAPEASACSDDAVSPAGS